MAVKAAKNVRMNVRMKVSNRVVLNETICLIKRAKSQQIIMKSISLDKQVKAVTALKPVFFAKSARIISFSASLLLFLTSMGHAAKYDKEAFFKLEADVQALVASATADAAPLEIKFIKEKMVLAKKAKAEKKKKLEAQLSAQIRAEMKIAQLRADVNALNAELLNKRDQISASEVYILDLEEQLQ